MVLLQVPNGIYISSKFTFAFKTMRFVRDTDTRLNKKYVDTLRECLSYSAFQCVFRRRTNTVCYILYNKGYIKQAFARYMPDKWGHIVGVSTLIARFMGPTWGPSGANRTQVGPMLAPWTLLSGQWPPFVTLQDELGAGRISIMRVPWVCYIVQGAF